jgi:hypothetical protein
MKSLLVPRQNINRMLTCKIQLVIIFCVLQLLLFTGAFAQLSGTYTIGPSGNYSTISAAVTDLATNGVSGPVTFKVASGTFNEAISIPSVNGTSSTNTISFTGAGRGKTFLQNGSNVLNFNGCSWISFNGFSVSNTSTSYALYAYNSTSCSVLNCDLKASASCCSYCVYVINNTNWNMVNNHIAGGYYGIYNFSGNSNYYGNSYTNNRIVGFGYYAMLNYGSYNNKYFNNIIDSSANGYGYGIYSNYESGSEYNSNKIIAPGLYYPALVQEPNYYSSQAIFKVVNNIFSGFTYYLYFYNYYASNMLVAHNTIYGNTNYYAVYFNNYYCKSGINILDNIFYGGGSNPVFYNFMYGSTLPSPFGAIDGNTYINPSGGPLVYFGSVYTKLSDYQTAMSSYSYTNPYNSTSGVFEGFASATAPTFISPPGDLHVDQTKIAPFGVYAGVDNDIDGDQRCKLFPTAGADESNYGKSSPTVLFYLPTNIYPGSPTYVYQSAKQGEPKMHQWYLNGVLISTSTVLFTNKFVTGSNTLELKSVTCGGTGSYKKTFTVSAPTTVPGTAFISNKNSIMTGENVSFMDLSTYGPTNWLWDISPATVMSGGASVPAYKYINGTSATDQNPQVQFLFGGKYTVCMTAGNGVGKGNKVCKSNYIKVMPSVNLASGTVKIHDAEGYLFDNGGPFYNYHYDNSNGFIESAIIDPCADSVYLTFTQFDTYCGYDFVRLFEGRDNTGKALWNSKCTSTGYNGLGPGYSGGKAYSCPLTCMPNVAKPDTFKAKSAMYLQMVCYGAFNSSGFAAHWWSKPKTSKKPVASFSSVSSVCVNGEIYFTNTTKTDPDDPATFLWDLDGDITAFECIGTCATAIWPYYLAGPVKITLIATNCGGTDTFSQVLNVFNPAAPYVPGNVTADNVTPTTNDIVFFTSTIPQCVDNYSWNIHKSKNNNGWKPTYVNGTSSSSADPQVMFSDTGYYTVAITVDNITGTRSDSLVNYIHVRNPYCIPSVATLNSGIGISKVVFNTISNKTVQASQEYTNFATNLSLSTTIAQGVTYKLTISRDPSRIYDPINRTVYIDWNGDGNFTGSGEIVASDSNSYSADFSANIKVPATAKIGATIMRVAVNLGSYANSPCGMNAFGEFQDYRLYITPYNIKPVITLKGHQGYTDTMYLEQGYPFIEPGDSASSLLYGTITKNIVVKFTPPLSIKTGVYLVSYDVKDPSGNAADTKYRLLKLTPDKTPPDLIVAGPDTIIIDVTKTPVRPHVPKPISADDLVDGPMLPYVNCDSINVLTNILGIYIVHYYVSDFSGNAITVTRVVKVVDRVKPVITLLGQNPATQEVLHGYKDDGVNVSDNYYPASILNPLIVVTSSVDTTRPGQYTYTYNLTDPSGNKADPVTRIVKVVDTIKPVLKLNGKALDSVEVFSSYTDPGVSVTDNYDQPSDITLAMTGSYYTSFPSGNKPDITGMYTIIYTATDRAGNSASVTRVVKVQDRQAPVITLKGDATVSVCRWFNYVDAGYVVSDNYNKISDLDIKQFGTFYTHGGTTLQNLLYIQYSATDKSGNTGYSDKRYILIKPADDITCVSAIQPGLNLDRYISIYPNPGNGLFYISSSLQTADNVSVVVTDMMGQDIVKVQDVFTGKNSITVDLSSQPAGIYLFKIMTNNQSTTRQVVITK